MPYDPLKSDHPGCGLDLPDTYWAATGGDAAEDEGSLAGDITTDVAIIGGGYTGLSCAYHLARNGAHRPVVLEANRPGWGCSGRNGSFTRPALGRLSYEKWVRVWGLDRAQALFREALSAVQLVRDLIQEGDIDCDAQPDGLLKIAHTPRQIAALEAEQHALRRWFGFESELLDRKAIEDRHFISAEAFAALHSRGSFCMHPVKLAMGLVRMARAQGARVHRASPVLRWDRAPGLHVLTTPNGRIKAREVVIATNGYSSEGLHPCLKGRLLPVLSNIIVTRPLRAAELEASRFATTDAVIDTRRILNYYRLLPDRRVLLGSRGPIRDTAASRAHHKRRLLRTLQKKFPQLADVSVDYFWGGWVCIPYDFMPHVAIAEDDTSVHYGLGYSGSGVSASIYAGKCLATRIAGEPEMNPILNRALPRFPLPALRRVAQTGLFAWYQFLDRRR